MNRHAAVLFSLLVGTIFPALADLPEPVALRLRAAGIPEDAIGFTVQRLEDGRPVLAHHPDRSRQPASTLKVLTSLVALEKLGPTYRGRTELRTRGEVAGGVLSGDLLLRGMGDVDFDWQSLERMLQVLALQGVREIRGDFVLDLGFFKPSRTDLGIQPFDEAPEFRYNVIPDALMLNSNLMQLTLVSGDREVRAALMTPLENVVVDSSGMKLALRSCEDWEDGWIIPTVAKGPRGALRITLRGDFPPGCVAHTSINVIDRVVLADRLFRALWRRLGGRFEGRTREGETPPDSRLVTHHSSRTLGEIARDINKRSDNPITRVMFLTLGATSTLPGEDSTARRADAEVRAWLERRGIDPRGIVLENGSGLSRIEMISPSQLAAVLRHAAISDWAPEFTASLPIAAVDGGMQKRLRDSSVASRARLKTGTLRDVTALAGYMKDDSGRALVVVAMINHPLATKHVARPILDALVDWVARSGTAAPAARPGT
jgi:D-alanyl-D-alanine carboxypeptidase/D-alanyl-D-alanine-endopeptidase (penicillin-binding protein 4)